MLTTFPALEVLFLVSTLEKALWIAATFFLLADFCEDLEAVDAPPAALEEVPALPPLPAANAATANFRERVGPPSRTKARRAELLLHCISSSANQASLRP